MSLEDLKQLNTRRPSSGGERHPMTNVAGTVVGYQLGDKPSLDDGVVIELGHAAFGKEAGEQILVKLREDGHTNKRPTISNVANGGNRVTPAQVGGTVLFESTRKEFSGDFYTSRWATVLVPDPNANDKMVFLDKIGTVYTPRERDSGGKSQSAMIIDPSNGQVINSYNEFLEAAEHRLSADDTFGSPGFVLRLVVPSEVGEGSRFAATVIQGSKKVGDGYEQETWEETLNRVLNGDNHNSKQLALMKSMLEKGSSDVLWIFDPALNIGIGSDTVENTPGVFGRRFMLENSRGQLRSLLTRGNFGLTYSRQRDKMIISSAFTVETFPSEYYARNSYPSPNLPENHQADIKASVITKQNFGKSQSTNEASNSQDEEPDHNAEANYGGPSM